MASPPPPSRVATPPLMAPVPLDTPRFTDLGKENLLHPTLLKTITEDLKFDHSKPYVHVRLFFFLCWEPRA
jgi:ATP-dependent RNA helicase MSS116